VQSVVCRGNGDVASRDVEGSTRLWENATDEMNGRRGMLDRTVPSHRCP